MGCSTPPTTPPYVSILVGRNVSRDEIETDILEAIDFMDDRLWCAMTATDLALEALGLEPGPLGDDSVKAVVRGVADPLQDPRLARLVVALRAYRAVDAVVVFAADLDWRIFIEPGEPACFMPQLGDDPIESTVLSTKDLDQLAGGERVLADLFPRSARVA